MNARQQETHARFGQILSFLDANTSTIPPALVSTQRQILANAIIQIDAFTRDQTVKGPESVLAQSVSSARRALRDTYMRQLSRVGIYCLTGKHSGDPDVPNARQIFTLPKTRKNPLTLLASAKAMVAAAEPYAAMFATNGVSLDAANAAIQALETAVEARATGKRVSQGATAGIKARIHAGHEAVGVMDVVVRPLLAPHPALVAQWVLVKRAAGGHKLGTPVADPTDGVPAGGAQQPAGTPPATAPVTTPVREV